MQALVANRIAFEIEVNGGKFRYGYEWIADRINSSYSGVWNAVDALVKSGHVRKEPRYLPGTKRHDHAFLIPLFPKHVQPLEPYQVEFVERMYNMKDEKSQPLFSPTQLHFMTVLASCADRNGQLVIRSDKLPDLMSMSAKGCESLLDELTDAMRLGVYPHHTRGRAIYRFRFPDSSGFVPEKATRHRSERSEQREKELLDLLREEWIKHNRLPFELSKTAIAERLGLAWLD